MLFENVLSFVRGCEFLQSKNKNSKQEKSERVVVGRREIPDGGRLNEGLLIPGSESNGDVVVQC